MEKFTRPFTQKARLKVRAKVHEVLTELAVQRGRGEQITVSAGV